MKASEERSTKAERDDMAIFLLSVPYPPAQRRAYTNVLSKEAEKGFKLFHVDGDLDPGKSRPNVCGDCHRMPFWVSTNTPGTGMEAPTWRGAYDRWLILPQGRLNLIDFDFFRKITEVGTPERELWRFSWGGRKRFHPVWDMVLEGSTGFPGAFARQVTLNQSSTKDEGKQLEFTSDVLGALETSASEGGVVLQAEGVFIDGAKARPVELEFDPKTNGGAYVERSGDHASFSKASLVSLASEGKFVGTFTARLGANVDVDNPQPALWTLGPIQEQRGRQVFPIVFAGNHSMTISGRNIRDQATLFVDGRKVEGSLKIDGETVNVELATLPGLGTHFLQVQNPNGLFSNDFIFHVAENAQSANAVGSQKLSDILGRTKWDRIIGTWVDAGSNGAVLTSTYAWKIKDEVIEVVNKEAQKQSISLITIDAKTREVVQRGADSQGTTFVTKWEFEEKGEAVLGVNYASRDGGEGSLSIRQRLENDNSFVLSLELPQPITIRMTRAKP